MEEQPSESKREQAMSSAEFKFRYDPAQCSQESIDKLAMALQEKYPGSSVYILETAPYVIWQTNQEKSGALDAFITETIGNYQGITPAQPTVIRKALPVPAGGSSRVPSFVLSALIGIGGYTWGHETDAGLPIYRDQVPAQEIRPLSVREKHEHALELIARALYLQVNHGNPR